MLEYWKVGLRLVKPTARREYWVPVKWKKWAIEKIPLDMEEKIFINEGIPY